MPESHINLKRIFYDFIFTLVLTAILCALLMKAIGLTISDFLFSIVIPASIIIAIIISFFHWLLCNSDIYFWKFAFLLPGDIFYYIIATNNGYSCIYDEEIKIKLPEGSVLIRPKPNHKNSEPALKDVSRYRDDFRRILKGLKCHHAGFLADKLASHISDNCGSSERSLWKNRTGALSIGESESYVLWMHTKINRTLIPIDTKNKFLDLTISHCDWDRGDFCKLDSLYLLISKNVILLLIRLIVLAFFILLILMQNPPLNIVTEPLQVQENWTYGEMHYVPIAIKNIGCDLFSVNVLNLNSSNDSSINATWSNNRWPNRWPRDYLKSGEIGFINLSVQRNCSPGEYRGNLVITANAKRNPLPDLIPYYTIIPPTFYQTYAKTLVEVPFFIRIAPKPNATVHLANGKLKHENFHPSSSRR